MSDTGEIAPAEASPRWRISKACQECRRRKIRCDGGEPCQHCRQRKSECEYRGFVRQRKRKHELLSKNEEAAAAGGGGGAGGAGTATAAANIDEDEKGHHGARTSSLHRDKSIPGHDNASRSTSGPRNEGDGATGNNSGGNKSGLLEYSVAATHVASPSCIIQLYYGPTSNFSLMQLMYRQLVEGLGDGSSSYAESSRREEVEEVGAGLDLFSLRRLFFGDLAGNQDMSIAGPSGSCPLFFIHPSTASKYLERYLSTIYYLLPWQPKERYREKVYMLYQEGRGMALETPEATIIILILACGATLKGEFEMGDFLLKKAKENAAGFDEVVNLQTIQVPLLMAHYQSQRARPNSAFLCLGIAVRKALAAGLHKNTHFQVEQTTEDAEEKRITFWTLFFFEIFVCFGVGRPNTIPANEVTIPDPKEQPLLLALVELARIMARCARSMYGQRHNSLLFMWKNAREIRKDLHAFARRVQGVLNFGLDASPKPGEVGVCQIILLLLYHNLMLLTFRPFLIFRARWRQDSIMKQQDGKSEHITIPSWLDEACEPCLEASRCIIRNLSEACQINDRIREIHYHSFFLETACFTLAFDMMHSTPQIAEKHLPWVRSGLRCLASMLPGGQYKGEISLTMKAIQQMLIAVFPELSEAEGPELLSNQGTNIRRNAYSNDNSSHQSFNDVKTENAYNLPVRNAIPDPNFPGEPMGISQQIPQTQQQQQPQPPPPPLPMQLPLQQNQPFNQMYTSPSLDFGNTNPSAFFSSLGQNLMATPLSSSESNPNVKNRINNSSSSENTDDLVDFTQADIMDWKDFDFSTMDLEAFMSLDPSVGLNTTTAPPNTNTNNKNQLFPLPGVGNTNINYANQPPPPQQPQYPSASPGNQSWGGGSGGNDMGGGYGPTR